MMNFTKKQKRNPWRNTRQDFEMPWKDIWASVFMAILPITILIFASNFVLRSATFYSHFFSKTEIVKEIPYSITSDDLAGLFSNFMMHKEKTFNILENSSYKPQYVFTDRAGEIMSTLRGILDVSFILGVILLIGAVVIIIYLWREKENSLITESFKSSWIWFAALVLVDGAIFLIPGIRSLIFRQMFGVRFEAGDVLIQIFEGKLPMYFAQWQIGISIGAMLIITYLIHKAFGRRKMFRM